jgi:hypothetical protein
MRNHSPSHDELNDGQEWEATATCGGGPAVARPEFPGDGCRWGVHINSCGARGTARRSS